MMPSPLRPHAPLLETVLDQIGLDIVSGKIPAGEKFTLQTLCESFSISRTVARETMRALEHLGMVSSSRRVGITVLPAEHWSVFSDEIIRWRLRVPSERKEQLASLNELREAITPSAAKIAANAASQRESQRLRDLAAEIRDLSNAEKGASEEFLNSILEYHAKLLFCSNNEMFRALTPSVSAVIRARQNEKGAQPALVECYTDLADAIHNRDALAAEKLCTTLLRLESDITA